MTSSVSSVDADGESDDGSGFPVQNGLPIDPSLFASEELQDDGEEPAEIAESHRVSSSHSSGPQGSQSSSASSSGNRYDDSGHPSSAQPDYLPAFDDHPIYPQSSADYGDPIDYERSEEALDMSYGSRSGHLLNGGSQEYSLREEPIAGPSRRLAEEDVYPPLKLEPPHKRRRTASSIASSSKPSSSRSRSQYPPLSSTQPILLGTDIPRNKPGPKPKQLLSAMMHGPRPKAKGRPSSSAFDIGNNQYLVSANGKPPREPECSFCQGTDERNRDGAKEDMLSCDRCGRSGHPSCLSMTTASLRAAVRTYPWQCIECKVCEICNSKGDDNRLMFCDGCDRGWHSYCLDPPLNKPPKGQWICPTCKASRAASSSKRAGSASSSCLNRASVNGKDPSIHGQNRESPETGLSHPMTGKKVKGKGKERAYEHDEAPVVSQNGFRGKGTPNKFVLGPGYRPSPVIKLRIPVPHFEATPKVVKRRGRQSKMDVRLEEEENASEEVYEKEPTPVPFGGVIEGPDADTNATAVTAADKAAFERSRRAADLKLGTNMPDLEEGDSPRARSSTPDITIIDPSYRSETVASGSGFRPLRDRLLLQNTASSGLPQSTTVGSSTRPNLPASTASLGPQVISEKIRRIRFGQFDIDIWYAAPYPEEYARVPDGRLWICEFCLKYMKSGFVAGRHRLKCKTRHPPGDEIYREGSVSVFEVDGRKNKIYCQNLCLIAKMFLDHKTLYYDVEPFLFYVMTEVDEDGAKFVGYFSKEKRSATNNVSCIMTLPVRQRKGWGNLLIDFSYLLSKKEGRTGSPEKPLSGLGALSYRNYWTSAVFRFLDTAVPPVTLDQISSSTSMMLEDVFTALEENDMIDVYDSAAEMARRKTEPAGFWPNGGLARQALSRNNLPTERTAVPVHYQIHWDPAVIQAHMDKIASKGWLKLRPEKLKYTPFLVTRVAFGKDGMLVSKSLTQVQADALPDHEALTVDHVLSTGVSVDAGPLSEAVAEETVEIALAVMDDPSEERDFPSRKSDGHSLAIQVNEVAKPLDTAPPSSQTPEVCEDDSHDDDFNMDAVKDQKAAAVPMRGSLRTREVNIVGNAASPRRSSVRRGMAASLMDEVTLADAQLSQRETRGGTRMKRSGAKA